MKVRLFIIIVLVVLASLLFADSKADYLKIKGSQEYYIGESSAGTNERVSEEQLKKTALANLILQIQANVQVNVSDVQAEYNGRQEQIAQQRVEMSSKIKLSGYNFISYKDKKTQYVLAYLNKSVYRRWLDEQSSALIKRMEIAGAKEERIGIESVISEYLNIYTLTMMLPQAIAYNDKPDLNLYVYNILYDYLQESRVQSAVQKPNAQTPDAFPISFNITNAQVPLNNVKLAFEGDDIAQKVIDGKAELYIFGFCSEKRLKKKMVLNYDSEMADLNKEVQELLQEYPICYSFNHEIDFSNLVNIDIEIKQDGAEINLKPIIENISVKSLEWQFGDDSPRTAERNPKYVYARDGVYRISLTVNNLFTVTKAVTIGVPKPKVEDKKSSVQEKIAYRQVTVKQVFASQADIDQLLSFERIREAIAWLSKKKNEGKLIFGSKDQLANADQAYILLFDAKSERIISLISPEDNGRIDLRDQQAVKDSEILKKGRGGIWIQFLK